MRLSLRAVAAVLTAATVVVAGAVAVSVNASAIEKPRSGLGSAD